LQNKIGNGVVISKATGKYCEKFSHNARMFRITYAKNHQGQAQKMRRNYPVIRYFPR